ncbi:methylated-DNA--[protein]-cysteine S-methyltransferase [Streptomyces sp. NPDC055078]
MNRQHTVVDSPYGALTLVATDGVLSGLYMTDQRHRPGDETFGVRLGSPQARRGRGLGSPQAPQGQGDGSPQARQGHGLGSPFGETIRQLEAYFAGELTEFAVPLRLAGTPFQRAVWDRLLAIPYGETRTYGELAEELGNPNASRAVGLANGKNPVSIIVPCHRVIGSTGSLTGYGGGLSRKQRLLSFESGRPDEALF